MPAAATSTDLLGQIRSQIDETSVHNVSDSDLLAALNRAQDYAADLMVRHYPDPLLDDPFTFPLVSGQVTYPIPEDIFEERLLGVEAFKGTAPNIVVYPLLRVQFSDLNMYESSGRATVPQIYCVVGKNVYIRPIPSGVYSIRMWKIKELDPIVTVQGRVTNFDPVTGRVFLAEVGTDLTTSATDSNCYINFVDAQTGLVKGSAQVMTLSGADFKIKPTPDRTTVQNRTISGTLPANLEVDDLVCVSKGNCVPIMRKPFTNFLIQYTVCEIKRRLGEDVTAEKATMDAFEDQVKKTWVGREITRRVQKRSKHWYRPTRRWLSST